MVAAVLFGIDQFTKYLAVLHLKGNEPYVLIDGVLELQYLENRGSAFGMLENQKVFILFVGIVFMAVILFFLFKLPSEKKFNIVHILLSCIIAAAQATWRIVSVLIMWWTLFPSSDQLSYF